MRKSLGFIVLVSLLLLLAACQPKAAPEKEVVAEEVDTAAELDGEAFADIEDFNIEELDELDNLEAELEDLENLDFE